MNASPFQLEWPDGQSSTLYSPSTVILQYLKVGDSFRVSEFESLGVKPCGRHRRVRAVMDLPAHERMKISAAPVGFSLQPRRQRACDLRLP